MPKDKTQSHALLLKAAKEEFLAVGYENASMRSIAAKAGMTGGALYKHFTGKEELYCAILDPVYQEMLDLFRSETENAGDTLCTEGAGAFKEDSLEVAHMHCWTSFTGISMNSS